MYQTCKWCSRRMEWITAQVIVCTECDTGPNGAGSHNHGELPDTPGLEPA